MGPPARGTRASTTGRGRGRVVVHPITILLTSLRTSELGLIRMSAGLPYPSRTIGSRTDGPLGASGGCTPDPGTHVGDRHRPARPARDRANLDQIARSLAAQHLRCLIF